MKKLRQATVVRNTSETQIKVQINLDGKGNYSIKTPIGFVTHMLELFSKHSLIDCTINAKGDTQVDFHHTVEDLGLVLGEAVKKALGNKKALNRYGHAFVPMDETLTMVAVDISGRPYLHYAVLLRHKKVGDFPVVLVEEFLRAFVQKAEITLHVTLMHGKEPHHVLESVFKSLARALMCAVSLNKRIKTIPSTKGKL